MTESPTSLVCHLTRKAQWTRILEKCREYDVEAITAPEYVYDVRDDYVLYWGRDGWDAGFWHAKFWLVEDDGVMSIVAEQGHDDRAASVLKTAERIRDFIQDCMQATEVT